MNGDFQGLENWSSDKDITLFLRDIGIDINFLCVPYHGGDICAPGIAPLEIKSGKPIFYLVKRGAAANLFDKGLEEQALSLGVEIIFNGNINSAPWESRYRHQTGESGFYCHRHNFRNGIGR
jgi:hypothetical protein